MPPIISKPKSQIFNYFNEVTVSEVTKYKCNFCGDIYSKHATRMVKHVITQCKKVSSEVRSNIQNKLSFSTLASATLKKKETNQLLLYKDHNINSTTTNQTVDINSNKSDEHVENSGASNSKSNSTSSKINHNRNHVSFMDNITPEENEILNGMLSKAILVTGSPFSLIEHKLWKEFFHRIRPSYILPNRKAIGGKYLEEHYINTVANVDSEIGKSDILHLQCDGWSNIKNEGVINFVLNHPEPVFIRSEFTEDNSHTGIYIKGLISDIMKVYGPEKFAVIIGDNANNMKCAQNLLKAMYPFIIVLHCICHTLNLLCKDLTSSQSCADFLKSTNDVINHIRKSQVLNSKFSASCEKALALYCKTRWGTNEKSLKRLLDNKFNLQTLAISPGVKMDAEVQRLILNPEFWKNVEAAQNVLKPITSTLTYFEGDGILIHTVYEKLKNMKLDVLTAVEKFKDCPIFCGVTEKMISDLDIRFSAMLEPIHCAAAMLDPQTKGKCLSDEDRMRAMEFIHSIFEQHPIFKTENYIQVNIVQDLANYLSNEGYWSHRFLWDVEKIQISPLSWWKGLCGTTALSKIAELILTSPISSVATERSFKTFSDTHTKKRNRLDSKKASKVVFVSHNWKLEERRCNPKPKRIKTSNQSGTSTSSSTQETDKTNDSDTNSRISLTRPQRSNVNGNKVPVPDPEPQDSDIDDDLIEANHSNTELTDEDDDDYDYMDTESGENSDDNDANIETFDVYLDD